MNRNRSLAFAALTVYVVLVFFLCLHDFSGVRFEHIPKTLFGLPVDKCIHFVMFLPLPPLIGRFGATAICNSRPRMPLFGIIIVSLAIALSSEVSQYLFTSNRQFELSDLTADVLAILCGTTVWAIAGCLRYSESRVAR